jgi:hypothetical protein
MFPSTVLSGRSKYWSSPAKMIKANLWVSMFDIRYDLFSAGA